MSGLQRELRVNSESCERSRRIVSYQRKRWEQKTRCSRLATILWTACLLAGILAGIASSGGASEIGSVTPVISGVVSDETGVPVGPGIISLFSDEYSLVTTTRIEDDGSYEVEFSDRVSLLKFEIPGFHPEIRSILSCIPESRELPVTVKRATSAITGVVVDPVGIPMDSARVMLFSQSQGTCISSVQAGSDGRFRFDVAAGDYVISAWASSFAFGPQPVSTFEQKQVELILVGVPADVRVSGRVLDEHGNPVAEAKVSVYTDDGRFVGGVLSDSSGYYCFYLPAGVWDIKVWKTGWTHIGSEVKIERGRLQYVQDIVVKRSSATVSGLVISGDGRPVPNVWIEVTDPESGSWVGTASTDESGRFAFQIAPGVWDLSFLADGHMRTCVRVEAVQTDSQEWDREPIKVAQRPICENALISDGLITVVVERMAD